MIAYHWTTRENADRILIEGLKQWSFVCREQSDWHGDVCLAVEIPEMDWDERDEHARWQAVVHEHIPPEKIKRI